jgi:tetratricopeptide (TPR) repeat protein
MIRPACVVSGRPLAATGLLVVLCTCAPADTVPSTGQQTVKIEEVEKAKAALQKGQIDKAYEFLVEATKKDADMWPARFMLAKMLSQVRNMGSLARAHLEQAAAENPDHPIIYLQNAEIDLQDGRYSDAVLNCEKALALAQSDRWSAKQKRDFKNDAHNYLSAVAEFRKHWPVAATHLTALLEAQPKDVKLRVRLAQALFFMDKPDDAYAELKKAAAVNDPTLQDTPEVLMAQLWTAKGAYPKAREWLNKAAKAGEKNVRVKLAYADWLLNQNDIDGANVYVRDAVVLDAKNIDVLRKQGLIARVKRDFKTATDIFQKIIAQAPTDAMARNQLALCLADSPDTETRKSAIPHAQLNVQANQKNAEAWATLGYCFYKLKDFEEAAKALQVATSGGQLSSDTGYYWALYLAEKEQYENAKSVLEGALDPKLKGLFVYRTDAQKLLDEVKKKIPPESKDKDKDKGKDKAKTNN